MPSKVTFLAGFATGYVFGSRAGRARYEQIRKAARSVMASPAVAATTSTLQDQAADALGSAKDKAAATLSGKIGERLGDLKPSWLGPSSASSTGMPTSGAAGTPPATAAANGGTGHLS